MCVAGTCPVCVELGEEINQLLLISEQYVLNWLRLVWIGNKHLIMKRRWGEREWERSREREKGGGRYGGKKWEGRSTCT